jgi:hypothetical protein
VFTNPMDEVHPMSVEAAYDYASALVEIEGRGSDTDAALHRLEQRYGLSPNQVQHLRFRRAKTCDVSLFARLRGAYLDLCERQIARLQHTLEIERLSGDVSDQDLADRLSALAQEVEARKAARRSSQRRAG